MPDPHDDLDLAQTLRGGGQPTLLNRYRIVRELGHGGMGSVYLAEDTQLDGRLVAIKMPSAILARNKRAVADLKREAATAMALSHPAIVTLRSFEQSDEGVFLVMDYVEGETLEDMLADKGTLTPEEVVKLLQPVAEALDYAHDRRVIHRDLKPANILIDNEGRAHLTDFGIAREMKDTLTRVTGRQDTSGTLPYMSPEQVHGENPTPAQDIYSFGALLYECLAGRPPFFRGQIEHQILNKTPDAEALEGVSDGLLREAVLRCLAKKPDLRPGKAVEAFVATSRDREGAGIPPLPEHPLPDVRGSSETNPSLGEVFDDLFSGKPLNTPPTLAAKPWDRPPQAYTPKPAPRATTTLAPPDKRSDAAHWNTAGCFLALTVVVFLAVVFAAMIWALFPGELADAPTTFASSEATVGAAEPADRPGTRSPHADRPDELGNILNPYGSSEEIRQILHQEGRRETPDDYRYSLAISQARDAYGTRVARDLYTAYDKYREAHAYLPVGRDLPDEDRQRYGVVLDELATLVYEKLDRAWTLYNGSHYEQAQREIDELIQYFPAKPGDNEIIDTIRTFRERIARNLSHS